MQIYLYSINLCENQDSREGSDVTDRVDEEGDRVQQKKKYFK
jgi:hypothetical protein